MVRLCKSFNIPGDVKDARRYKAGGRMRKKSPGCVLQAFIEASTDTWKFKFPLIISPFIRTALAEICVL